MSYGLTVMTTWPVRVGLGLTTAALLAACVAAPAGARRPELGEVVAIIPNHICPVIDLVDTVVVLNGDRSGEVWPVDARGRSG